MGAFEQFRLASTCLGELQSRGYRVDAFNDFERVKEFVSTVGKVGVTPKMDPDFNDFTRPDCTWFQMSDQDGVFAVIGAKLEDLGDEGLGSFLMRSTNRQYSGQGAGAAVRQVASDAALGISGRTVYIGELQVAEGRRGRRDLLRLLVIFVIAYTTFEWKADHAYAFFRERDVMGKMPQLYGFSDCVPGAMLWGEDHRGRASSEWLASISRARVTHLADLCSRDSKWLEP